jgi:hypothetical protein
VAKVARRPAVGADRGCGELCKNSDCYIPLLVWLGRGQTRQSDARAIKSTQFCVTGLSDHNLKHLSVSATTESVRVRNDKRTEPFPSTAYLPDTEAAATLPKGPVPLPSQK